MVLSLISLYHNSEKNARKIFDVKPIEKHGHLLYFFDWKIQNNVEFINRIKWKMQHPQGMLFSCKFIKMEVRT